MNASQVVQHQEGLATRPMLLTGAGGGICRELRRRMPHLHARYASSSDPALLRLDLDDPAGFDRRALADKPLVVHTAALSSPEICRKEPDRAWRINVEASVAFLGMCLDEGCDVVFFSSDTVYGHTDAPADEATPVNPCEPYAEMKAEVERRFLGVPGFKSFRLSYVLWQGDKFTTYLAGCAREGRQAEIFHPFERCPVYIGDLFQALIAVRDAPGALDTPALNVAGPDLASRVRMAQAFQAACPRPFTFTVVEPEEAFFASRPRRIALRSDRLARLTGHAPLSVEHVYQLETAGVFSCPKL